MNSKFFKIVSTALCGMILSTTLLSAGHNSHRCRERSRTVKGIEKKLSILRGTVFNQSFTQNPNGTFATATCIPLRPLDRNGNPIGFTTTSSIVDFGNISTQFRSGLGLPTPAGVTGTVRAVNVVINVIFDCPMKSDPSVVVSLEDSAAAVLANADAAVSFFGIIVDNVTTNGFTANIIFEVFADSDAAAEALIGSFLNPAAGAIKFNFIAAGPKC